MSRKISLEQERMICDLYESTNTGILSSKFNVCASTIANILKRNGLSLRKRGTRLSKYKINTSYFNIIDTEEKAYFLGLIGSDGCVSSSDKRPRVEIGLSGEEDKVLLQAFKDALEYTGPIRLKKTNYLNAKPHFNLSFSDRGIRNDLIKHGIVPNKSLIYEFNNKIPANLLRHYVRGYFDGDGSVSYKKDRSFLISITSSRLFVDKLQEVIRNEIGIATHLERAANSNAFSLKIGGNFVSFLFLHWIYNDAKVFLPRKYEKYLLCKQIICDKLNNPNQFYNIYFLPDIMKNANLCAKMLNIPFDISSYNGLKTSAKTQNEIVYKYVRGESIRALGKANKLSNTAIRNVLKRNGVKIRGVNNTQDSPRNIF